MWLQGLGSTRETVWMNLLGVVFYLKDAAVVTDDKGSRAAGYQNRGVGGSGKQRPQRRVI